MFSFEKYHILNEASATPFLKFYHHLEKGVDPDIDTIDECLRILEFYYDDYIKWYDKYPEKMREPVQKRIYKDYEKQLHRIREALSPRTNINMKIFAVDQGISQWHYDFPVIAHMEMEEEDDREEQKWTEVGDILVRLGKISQTSPYNPKGSMDY